MHNQLQQPHIPLHPLPNLLHKNKLIRRMQARRISEANFDRRNGDQRLVQAL